MKKTLTVNLNNAIYYIDEDAYARLQSYLDSLTDDSRSGEEADVSNDIEARIAELFQERLRFGMQIITMREVEEVIAMMEHPEKFATDMSDNSKNNEPESDSRQESEKTQENVQVEPEPTYRDKTTERNRRRLFRDKEDAFLGGVASGLGYYLGASTLLIRILFVLFTFLTGYMLLVYLILWICIPEAKTAAQILEMKGEPVTADNIKRFDTDAENRGMKTSEKKTFGDYLLSAIKIILKFVVIFLGICFSFGLLSFFLLLLFLLFVTAGGTIGFMAYGVDPFLMQLLSVVHSTWMLTFFFFLLLGIPIYAILRFILRRLFDFSPQPRWVTVVLVVLWLLILVAGVMMYFAPSPEILLPGNMV